MLRPIAISLSPNTEKDDVFLALKTILSPWKWKNGKSVMKLEKKFASLFGPEFKAIAVNSGRSAEYLILKILGIGKGDEVAIQAFNCIAVPNSVLWLGAKPLYIDIDETYNIKFKDLSEKLSENTRAIIVQHTFGMPAKMELIKKVIQLAEKRFAKKIYLIEDCAHSLGARYGGKFLGTFADLAFFSFGRDKVLSSVFGGVILYKNDKVHNMLKKERDLLPSSSFFWIIQQLLHPILFSAILPTYNLGIGKFTIGKTLLFIFQKLKLLSFPVYNQEKKGERPLIFPGKMPDALAILALNQLEKLNDFNKKRQKFGQFYFNNLKHSGLVLPPKEKGAIWLRFPIRIKNAESLYRCALRKSALLGRWYRGVLQPAQSLDLIGYKIGSCPNAEKYSEEVVNLPTYPTMTFKHAIQVIRTVKQCLHTT